MIISSTKFFQLRSVQLFKKIQRHPTIILLSRKIKYSITEIGFSSIRTRIYTTSTPRLGKTRELLGRRSSWTRISSNTRSKSCRTRGCKRSEAYKRIPCRVVGKFILFAEADLLRANLSPATAAIPFLFLTRSAFSFSRAA